jgi:hypothetical protein
MPRQPNKPDRDFAARDFAVHPGGDKIDADLAELFALRPPGVDELYADPTVRMRIGMLITAAMNKPARH